jgi:hypothetical protein
MVSRLIAKIYELGYEGTIGDGYRDPRVFGAMGVRMGYSSANSNHKQRLAIDINLFRNGVFLQTTEDHRPIGEWWESQGGTWGGRFNDGNHYSLEHNGFK